MGIDTSNNNEKQNIQVPLPEWIEQLVKLTVKECFPKMIEEHQKNCPVATDVKIMQSNISKKAGVFSGIIATVISSLITALVFWLLFIYKTH